MVSRCPRTFARAARLSATESPAVLIDDSREPSESENGALLLENVVTGCEVDIPWCAGWNDCELPLRGAASEPRRLVNSALTCPRRSVDLALENELTRIAHSLVVQQSLRPLFRQLTMLKIDGQ